MNEALNLILTEKIGLTKKQTELVTSLSEKNAIWIGNQIKSFNGKLPRNFKTNITKIVSWIKENQNLELKSLTYKAAISEVKKSQKSPFKIIKSSLKNKSIVAVCHGTEYKWVEMKTLANCKEEGIAMSHCLKDNARGYFGSGNRIFSLRDKYNRPLITTQVHKNGLIGQYVSNGNRPPDRELAVYFPILEKQTGIKVDVASKMMNEIPAELTMEIMQEVLDNIVEDYRNSDLSLGNGEKKVQHLINCANKSGLKHDLSPDLLDNEEVYENEESLEYDDDGSLIC